MNRCNHLFERIFDLIMEGYAANPKLRLTFGLNPNDDDRQWWGAINMNPLMALFGSGISAGRCRLVGGRAEIPKARAQVEGRRTADVCDPNAGVVNHCGSILNRRSQPGTHPLHRIGLGDDLIDVIAIDALKQAHQPTTSNGGALLTFAHRPNFKVGRLDRDDVPE